MSYQEQKGRQPAAGMRDAHPALRLRIAPWLIMTVAAAGLAGWIVARAEAANPPVETHTRSTASSPASLTPDARNAAPAVVPDKAPLDDAASHGRSIQESNIAPADTSGDSEGIARPPARDAHAVASVDGLAVVRQALRRGGLGSKALMTLTIRNSNDYPVKHMQLLCAFSSRDGNYVTKRRHVIDGILKPNSRRTFRHLMVGFVSINANRAKCTLLSADWA